MKLGLIFAALVPCCFLAATVSAIATADTADPVHTVATFRAGHVVRATVAPASAGHVQRCDVVRGSLVCSAPPVVLQAHADPVSRNR